MPSPAVSASNLRNHVATLPSPSPASELLGFLTGAIFIFTSVLLHFPSAHTLDHLQELAPPLKSWTLVFHSYHSGICPPFPTWPTFLASLSFQPLPPLTFILVYLPPSCFCFLLHPAKPHACLSLLAFLSLSSCIPSALVILLPFTVSASTHRLLNI